MHRTHHRFLLTLTAGIAALALTAGPALAGSDGCSGGDCQDEDAPARVVPVPPVPVPPLGSDNDAPDSPVSKPDHAGTRQVVHGTPTVRVAQRTVPRGAVAAGAGGMAPHSPDGLLALLAGGGVVLLAAGGGLVASGRRAGS
jgi:hypothetical protein